ncbi:unnamed protein product [Orchesella dallaii]|uniref:C2H2-type domain-containing protein n=1 Tax=Orchesella dallaii TaxID=48710 RepID=A0ABP1RX39_9HEXA
MFTQVLSSHCIFCASPCLPKFTVINGQVSRIKSEPDLITPDSIFPVPTGSSGCQPLPHFLEEGEDCAQLAEQLNSIFILRNILGIREDKLCQFLGKLGGQFHPELWLQVCSACGESVKEFYETTKQFLKLQKKLKVISNELKGHIRETREGDYSSVEEVTGQVWKEVREEVLKEFGFNSNATQIDEIPPPTEQNVDSPMPHLERETEYQEKDQTRRKQKLITRPIDFEPDEEEPHSPPPMMILPPDIYVVEEVDAEEDDQNTNQSFISGDILPENPPVADDADEDDEIDEEYHFDLKYPNGNRTSSSLKTQINLSTSKTSQNQVFNPKKQRFSSIQRRSIEVVSPSSFRQYELDSVRRYPLPTLPFSECPRFSGVRVGKEQHYECLECSAKSNHWERFKAHLELHHPTAGAVSCGECGWLVHPGKMLRHTAQFHA